MKAIVLGAGQATRLTPDAAQTPGCLLPVQAERPLLCVQLRALAAAGIEDVCVVTGHRGELVDAYLKRRPVRGLRVRTLFNPFHDTAGDLIGCWQARAEMTSDVVLENGSTLFSPHALQCLLAAPAAPVTLAIDSKAAYDADDAKVALAADGRLTAIGRQLDPERADAQSIGLMSLRNQGPRLFLDALEDMVWRPGASQHEHLAAIDRLADSGCVSTVSVRDLWWDELSEPEDVVHVRALLGRGMPTHRSLPRVSTHFATRSQHIH